MMRMFFLFCLVLVVAGCGEEHLPAEASGRGFSFSDSERMEDSISRLYFLINERRKEAGVPLLLWSVELADLAAAQAHDLCERGYLSHINPEGEDPLVRAIKGQAGRFFCEPVIPNPFLLIGENIGEGFERAEDVLAAWMVSPLHCKNILDERYSFIGIGKCDSDGYFHCGCGDHWVVIFGAGMY
ncbi:MAG: CAP domain-containing protein [Planctomycetota bacterium]|nr:CAP domain-containing protein [Planctomycetota bacterium]